ALDAATVCLVVLPSFRRDRTMMAYRRAPPFLIGIGMLLVSGTACESSRKAEAQQDNPQEKGAAPPEQPGASQQPAEEERHPVAGSTTPRRGKPNILFIMGDDIGWMQPGIYHRGLMVGETPNIDRIGREGAIFIDYLAMQSCTSGRNAFFTGMYPLRT